MDRKEELTKLCGDNTEITKQLVDEIVYIENQLIELKKLPFIKVNPNNTMQQKSTPASKLYKELLQQYNNCIKTLARLTGNNETEEESPLRKWVNSRVNTK